MAHWQFRPLNPNETSGTSTVDDNFAKEERTSVEILVRETLQNPLDARHDSSLVRVCYKLAEIELESSVFTSSIFSDSWRKHFRAGKLIGDQPLPSKITFLTVEDFGTTGLEGCYTDSSAEGASENWNAFWFREGEGAKPTKSNGGAGQGKITLYQASRLRSVFALTKRQSDNKELLFGCCRFKRNYVLEGDKRRWAKEARWGAEQAADQLAIPTTNSSLISSVKHELGLKRTSYSGTSFLVPMPLEEVNESSLCEAIINEFFFAIRRGRLEVQVGERILRADTISDAADLMGERCRLSKNYREFLELAIPKVEGAPTATAREDWSKGTKLSEDAFESKDITMLKDAFELLEPISVDFPVLIKKREDGKSSNATFRVLLQQDAGANQSQELFIRQDLGIGGEKRLRASRVIQPVMALTFIQDAKLSEFLVNAEEPTHLNWNSRRPKVMAIYTAPDKVLNAVRNAALRLVQLISPEGKRDDTALALYFADPSDEQSKSKGSIGTMPNLINPGTKPIEIAIDSKQKPVGIAARSDGFTVKSRKVEPSLYQFPLQCEIEVAYATTEGDAYKLWDAADFWLNYEKDFPITCLGVEDVERDGNRLSCILVSEESELTVSGFDPRRQLEVRVKYRRSSDGTDIENH